MDASRCPGCAERDARIAELERRLAEVEARVKINASNSSMPPSANPLAAIAPVKKKEIVFVQLRRERGRLRNYSLLILDASQPDLPSFARTVALLADFRDVVKETNP